MTTCKNCYCWTLFFQRYDNHLGLILFINELPIFSQGFPAKGNSSCSAPFWIENNNPHILRKKCVLGFHQFTISISYPYIIFSSLHSFKVDMCFYTYSGKASAEKFAVIVFVLSGKPVVLDE